MIQENLFEETDPRDDDEFVNEKETEDNEEGYDILPSNGPGLAGDDGEQVIDAEEFDEDEDKDEEDD